MPEPPKILTRKTADGSHMFKVDRVELEFSNGVQRTYQCLRSGATAAVIIVPMLDDHTVLLVEEYAMGVERYELGLPKGRVDPGETHIEAADRELKEEAGYGARKLDLLKCMTQSPNYMQHKTQIVLAQDLYPEKLEGDEPEPLTVHPFPIDDIAAITEIEHMTEARTIAALYLARDWLRGNR